MTFTEVDFFKTITYFLQKKFEELSAANATQRTTRWLINSHETIECCLHIFLSTMRTLLACRKKKKKMMLRIYCGFAREAFNAQICTKQKYKSSWFNMTWQCLTHLRKLFWPSCISFLLNINLLINSIFTLLQLNRSLTSLFRQLIIFTIKISRTFVMTIIFLSFSLIKYNQDKIILRR